MKKYGWFLLIVAVIVIAPKGVLADEAVSEAVVKAPEWLGAVLLFLQGVPYIGPVLVEALKWVGVISTAATALSVALQAIFTIPELIAKWSGAQKVAEKIKKCSDLVLPWLKYVSMFNVQKKV